MSDYAVAILEADSKYRPIVRQLHGEFAPFIRDVFAAMSLGYKFVLGALVLDDNLEAALAKISELTAHAESTGHLDVASLRPELIEMTPDIE